MAARVLTMMKINVSFLFLLSNNNRKRRRRRRRKGEIIKGLRAVRFFDEVVRKGFQPDLITYGTIINGLCKIGNTDTAVLLLKEVEQVGSCQPGIVIYNTVIDGLCKDKRVNEFKIFSNMIGKGITPDVITTTA